MRILVKYRFGSEYGDLFMNARQKAKRLKKEVEMYKKLASRPSFIIPPHIETIKVSHPINTSMYRMYPVDLLDGLVEQTKQHIGEELGKYLYERKWLHIQTEHDDTLDNDVITAWIRIVVDNYDY